MPTWSAAASTPPAASCSGARRRPTSPPPSASTIRRTSPATSNGTPPPPRPASPAATRDAPDNQRPRPRTAEPVLRIVDDDVGRRRRGDERAQPGRLGQQRVAVRRAQLDERPDPQF